MRLRRLLRSPTAFWLGAIALACLSAVTVGRLVGDARAAADRLGAFRTVPVAMRDLGAGVVVTAGDVEARSFPAAFLPVGDVAADAVGRTVVVPVLRGEPLMAAKLAPDGLHGVAALLQAGRRAIAVPAGETEAPRLRVGDHVDVLATFDADTSDEPTFPVATAALVVDVGTDVITIAVTTHEAPRLAFALARGTVTLALTIP